MRILIHWLISALAVFLTAKILPGVYLDSFITAVMVAMVLGIINTVVKPLLFLLTLPITILTFGLFTLMLNVVCILITDLFVAGFRIESMLWAVLFGIILSVVTAVLHRLASN